MAHFPSPRFSGQQLYGTNFVIVNGRRVPVDAQVRGADLARLADAGPGRRPVKIRDGRSEPLHPSKIYTESDLKDRRGQPVKLSSIPDRTKGA